MDDKLTDHVLVTTESGAQLIYSTSDKFSISIEIDGDPVVSEQPLQLDPAQVPKLVKKLKTRTAQFDTMSQEITLMPKTTSTPAQIPKQDKA